MNHRCEKHSQNASAISRMEILIDFQLVMFTTHWHCASKFDTLCTWWEFNAHLWRIGQGEGGGKYARESSRMNRLEFVFDSHRVVSFDRRFPRQSRFKHRRRSNECNDTMWLCHLRNEYLIFPENSGSLIDSNQLVRCFLLQFFSGITPIRPFSIYMCCWRVSQVSTKSIESDKINGKHSQSDAKCLVAVRRDSFAHKVRVHNTLKFLRRLPIGDNSVDSAE